MVLFGLPMRGSGCCCCSRCRCSSSARSGTGLLISTVADTQQVAFQVALLVVVPADDDAVGLHLSDLEHAAGSCRSITYVVPARYFLVALRGIVLKGVGLDVALARSLAPWRSTRW